MPFSEPELKKRGNSKRDVTDLLKLPKHLIEGGVHLIEHVFNDIFDIPEDSDEEGSHKVKRDLEVAAKVIEGVAHVGKAMGGYFIPLGVDVSHIGQDVGSFVGDAVKPVKKALTGVFDKKESPGEAFIEGAGNLVKGTIKGVAETVIEKVIKRDVRGQIPDKKSGKGAELTDNVGGSEILGLYLKKTKVQGLQKCISEIMTKMMLMRYDEVKGGNALTYSDEEENWNNLIKRVQECFITMRYF